MECSKNDPSKKPRNRQMSREKRILANNHERERVRKMNDAYEELRSTIPNYEKIRVKTKLELLLIATNYIKTLKGHLHNVLQNGYNSPVNALMYHSAFDFEHGASRAVSLGITEFPCPPQYPAKPPPLSHLPLSHFVPRQTISDGSQNPVTLTNSADSLSSQELSGLFASSLTDLYTDENFLYTLQVTVVYNEHFSRKRAAPQGK